jgi:hypothetical protein
MKIAIGKLVECIETGRRGIVLDVERGADCMLALVNWDTGDGTNWVDFLDLQVLHYR